VRKGDNSYFRFALTSPLYTQLDSVFKGVSLDTRSDEREIFLYGHVGDCFSLGRYLCPDDLSEEHAVKKTGAIGSCFF
jgi:hypothetical protein